MKLPRTLMLGACLALAGCEFQEGGESPPSASAVSMGQKLRVGKLIKTPQALPGRYIVVLEDKAAHPSKVDTLAGEMARAHGASVQRVYRHALKGFSAAMNEQAALALSADPRVRYVEEDAEVSLSATQNNATWGIDRVDQRDLPLDTLYTYGATGAGVNAYIIDTGIRITHGDFAGRAFSGFDAINDGNGTNDCNGHGTHVAGTVGGNTWGVAKGVKLHAVRVLSCGGSGTWAGVIAGVDWVTANHVKPAVANMSLGGGAMQSVDDAVTNSINAGVAYAIAAGNDNGDACLKSPARTPKAMTVGSTTNTDARSSFSNYGTCVDIFAPGSNITSAWYTSDTSTNTISGTSMAAPHVAGVAALYLEQNPTATPQTVMQELAARATPGKVTSPGTGSPNLLLYSGCSGTGDTTPPVVALTAPVEGASLSGSVMLSADATDNVGVTRVEFFVDGRLIATDTTVPYEVAWDSTGSSNGPVVLSAKAYDGSCNAGTSADVNATVSNPGNATFDAALGAPACAAVGSQCDTVGLVAGRGPLGPERNAPNTLGGGTCADGTSGTYRSSPSLERLKVFRPDATLFAAGKQVRIEASVWASGSYSTERLDLYHAPDANSPTWTLLTTLSPSGSGSQSLVADLILPAGGLQAVRGVYRSGGTPASCTTGTLNDHDDVVFAVGTETDTQPPSSALTAPASGATVFDTVNLSASASDNFAVTQVEFFVGDTLVGTDTTAPFSAPWNTRSVANGSYSLTAKAWDAAGYSTASTAVTVVVDNDYTAPSVSVTAPTEGAQVVGITTLQASATDNRAIAKVEFYVDGALVGTDTTAPYSASWDSRTASNGAHALTAKATDTAGNAGTSGAVNVLVDNDVTAPSVALTAPSNGASVQGVVTIAANATDDRAVSKVDFFSGTTLLGSDTTAPYSISWDTSTLANGAHSLTAKATDAAGNVGTSSAVSVTVSNPGNASYDATLKAPRCDTVFSKCDTNSLVKGRANLGPEQNAPNTIKSACMDGTSGTYRSDESLERIRVLRVDGTNLAVGKKVRIEVDVWAYSSSNWLDLYYAADANNPVWTYLTTISAGASGARTLSAEYVLPAGSLQAVRGNFRYGGSASTCSSSGYDDRDDLIFAVGQETDTTPPTVTLTSPANGATVSGTVTVNANADDNFGVTKVEFYSGTTLLGTDTAAPFSASWSTTGVANGTYTLTAKAYDAAGQSSVSEVVVTVDNDTLAPTTAITSPQSGETVSGMVVISASASDNKAVSRVEFYRGTTLIGSDSSAPYSVNWDTTTLPQGSYTLSAKAYDTTGNVGTSATVTVNVGADTVAPTTSITSPAAGSAVSGTVTLQASASDNYGVTKVELYLDGALFATDTTSPYSASWDTLTTPNGSHVLVSKAYDAAGNVGTSASVTVTVDNDYTAPTVAITSPADGSAVFETLQVTADASDNKGVTKVEFFAGSTLLTSDTAAPYSASWGTRTVANGTYTLTAKAYDAAGYVGTHAITVVVDNDYTAPTVALTSPAGGSRVRGTIPVTADASDNRGVVKVEFFVGTTLLGSATTAPYAISWNSTTVPDGSYTLTARATDAAGNATTSAGVTVEVRQPGNATYDATLKAPACTELSSQCDSTTLVLGRAGLGPEKNTPNTILQSCFDGSSGSYRSDESLERIRVVRVDGTNLAVGKKVRIEVDVWAFSGGSNSLDLYYAADANNPVWTYLTTIPAGGSGARTLSAEYVLPAGSLQAVRGNFRYGGSPAPCTNGTYDDRDDLIFPVGPQELDSVNPTVTFGAPAGGTLLRGTVPLSAEADDNFGVTKVEFYAGTTLLGTDAVAPYGLNWSTTGVANGTHTLTAKAYDAAGNVTTSSGVSVFVDNAAPAVSFTSPVSGSAVRGVVTIQASASDNHSVTKVEFYDGSTLLGTDTTAPYSLSWDTTTVVEGSHSLTARAYDAAGNINNAYATLQVDNTVPAVAITSPAEGETVLVQATISANASDNHSVAKVEFYDGSTLIGTDTSAPYSVTWKTVQVAPGPHTLTARAYDAAGNLATSAGVTVQVK